MAPATWADAEALLKGCYSEMDMDMKKMHLLYSFVVEKD